MYEVLQNGFNFLIHFKSFLVIFIINFSLIYHTHTFVLLFSLIKLIIFGVTTNVVMPIYTSFRYVDMRFDPSFWIVKQFLILKQYLYLNWIRIETSTCSCPGTDTVPVPLRYMISVGFSVEIMIKNCMLLSRSNWWLYHETRHAQKIFKTMKTRGISTLWQSHDF